MKKYGKRAVVSVGMLLISACMVNAAILHGIPGGSPVDLPDTINTVVSYGGEPAGFWSSYQGWTGAGQTAATGIGVDRHIEIAAGWMNDAASVWYCDYGFTPTTVAYAISADFKWMGGVANHLTFGLFEDESMILPKFTLTFTGTNVAWVAGSQSGNYTSATGLTTEYQTVYVEYDPTTGEATGKLGTETIFNVITDMNMQVKTVKMANDMSGTYDVSALHVANITSATIPEPASMIMLLFGAGTAIIRYKRIK